MFVCNVIHVLEGSIRHTRLRRINSSSIDIPLKPNFSKSQYLVTSFNLCKYCIAGSFRFCLVSKNFCFGRTFLFIIVEISPCVKSSSILDIIFNNNQLWFNTRELCFQNMPEKGWLPRQSRRHLQRRVVDGGG